MLYRDTILTHLGKSSRWSWVQQVETNGGTKDYLVENVLEDIRPVLCVKSRDGSYPILCSFLDVDLPEFYIQNDPALATQFAHMKTLELFRNRFL